MNKKLPIQIDTKKLPIIAAAILMLIGVIFFNSNPGLMANFILLGLVVGAVPYFILSYFEYQKIKVIEDQLPNFLLDLAEAQKAGMSLPKALKIVSNTDYGRLTPEIKKISDQMSWGIPIQDALERFGWKMRKSHMIRRVVRILIESYESGGDIRKTMETTAEDITAVKDAEKERKSMMFQHVMVMYAIYFIFIGIIIGLSGTLIPMLEMNVDSSQMGGILSFQDPCSGVVGIGGLACSIYGFVCKMFALGTGATCYYHALFLLMVVVQGIFTGLVAGQIGEGSIIAGIKHSLIMTFAGFGILLLMLQTGFI